jgi:hypothetical protein
MMISLPQRGSRPIDGGMCLIALAFSTLLSSQGADAHLQRTPVRLQGNYSNLPDQPPPVNPKSWEILDREGGQPDQDSVADLLPQTRKLVSSLVLGFARGLRLAIRRPVPLGQEEL